MSNYLVTVNRGTAKLHRSTCKKANANPSAEATDDFGAAAPATCCKPRALTVVETPAPAAKKAPAKKPATKKASPQAKPVDRLLDKALARDAERRTEDVPASIPHLYDAGPDRVKAAKAEHKALAASKKAGEPLPATPNLDALNAEHAPGRPKAKKERKPRQRTEVKVRFMRGPFVDDLRPMPDSQNKLSSVAYYHTRGVKAWNDLDESLPRCTTETLRAILAHHGVEQPEQQPFEPIMLPNGTWLAAEAL